MPRGVRLNPKHDERTRAKIQVSQIINRLTKHMNGEVDMSASQIRAAEILLKKTLPDLSAVTQDTNLNVNSPEASIEDVARAVSFAIRKAEYLGINLDEKTAEGSSNHVN